MNTHNYTFSYSGVPPDKWDRAFGLIDELREELKEEEKKDFWIACIRQFSKALSKALGTNYSLPERADDKS